MDRCATRPRVIVGVVQANRECVRFARKRMLISDEPSSFSRSFSHRPRGPTRSMVSRTAAPPGGRRRAITPVRTAVRRFRRIARTATSRACRATNRIASRRRPARVPRERTGRRRASIRESACAPPRARRRSNAERARPAARFACASPSSSAVRGCTRACMARAAQTMRAKASNDASSAACATRTFSAWIRADARSHSSCARRAPDAVAALPAMGRKNGRCRFSPSPDSGFAGAGASRVHARAIVSRRSK